MKGIGGAPIESRRSATTRAIETAAFELFIDQGFSGTKAEDISTAAEISVRTFYRYFPEGKEGVVLRRARDAVNDLAGALRSRPPQEPAHRALRAAVLEIAIEWNSSTPTLSQPSIEVSSILYSQIAMQDSALLSRLIGERVLLLEPLAEQLALRLAVDPSVDVRPRLMAHAANSAITAAWFTAQANPNLDWADLIRVSLDALEGGFSSTTLREVRALEPGAVA